MAKKDFDNRRAQLRAMQQAEARKKKNRTIVLVVLAVVLAVVVVGGGVAAVLKFRESQEASFPPSANKDHTGMAINKAPDARKLEIYLDYQCPFCKKFEETMAPTIESMIESGDVEVTYHTMIFLDKNLRNDASERATNASYCADEQGVYDEFHKAVFQNQPQTEGQNAYPDALIRDELPKQVGLEGEKLLAFQTCYDDRKFDDYVKRVDNEAGKAGVTGTPTIRVDGEDIDLQQISSPEDFRNAVLN